MSFIQECGNCKKLFNWLFLKCMSCENPDCFKFNGKICVHCHKCSNCCEDENYYNVESAESSEGSLESLDSLDICDNCGYHNCSEDCPCYGDDDDEEK